MNDTTAVRTSRPTQTRPASLNAGRAARYTVLTMAMWLAFALIIDRDLQPGSMTMAIIVGISSEVAVSAMERRKARRAGQLAA